MSNLNLDVQESYQMFDYSNRDDLLIAAGWFWGKGHYGVADYLMACAVMAGKWDVDAIRRLSDKCSLRDECIPMLLKKGGALIAQKIVGDRMRAMDAYPKVVVGMLAIALRCDKAATNMVMKCALWNISVGIEDPTDT